jgi:prepilin-type processing-associated H-X9-DG protein
MSDAPDMTAPTPGKGLAISSMILGILGFVTCALTALPGLILGVIALAKGRPGKGMAIAGVVCSGVSVLLIPVMAALLFPAIGMVRVNANKAKDGNNLSQIASYVIAYDQEEGKPPSDLVTLQGWAMGEIPVRALFSPVGTDELPYLYIRPVDRSGFRTDLPLVMGDPDAFGSGSNIAFGDGHYEWWPESRARPLWDAVASAPEEKAWTAAELKALISGE